jgi:urea ABC transporter permease protein UrtB
MNLDIITTAIFNALSISSILVIAAIGLGIIYGMMGVINLAHGEFIMLGAYFTYIFSDILGINIWLAILLAPFPVAAIGLAIERGIIRFLYERQMDTLLATWGISIAIIQAIRLIFGPEGKSIVHPYPGTFVLFGLTFAKYRLLFIVITISLISLIYLIFRFTNFGLKARAVSHNNSMSSALGINTSYIYMLSFSFGAGLAGLAGALLTPLINIEPALGLKIVVRTFLVVVTGGANILFGPVVGGTLLGGTESVVSLFTTTYLGNVILLILAIFIIRIKPKGLLTKAS